MVERPKLKPTAALCAAIVLVLVAAAGVSGVALAQEEVTRSGVIYTLQAPDQVESGQEANITLAVYFQNPSSSGVTVQSEATLYVDGQQADTISGPTDVIEGEWTNTSFQYTFEDSGDHDVRIHTVSTFAGQEVSNVNVSKTITVPGAMDGNQTDGDGTNGNATDGDGTDGDGQMDGDDGQTDGDGDQPNGNGGGNGGGPLPGFTVVIALIAIVALAIAHRLR